MKERTPPDLSQELKEKRKQIDLIDQKLVSLLNQRIRIALEIGKIKRTMGEKIYDPNREKEVLERLRLRVKNKDPLKEKDLEKIFRTIISVSRKSQNRIKPKR